MVNTTGDEVLNLFGFIMYVIGMMWGAAAFIVTAIFTAAINSEGIRNFFAVKPAEVNSYILCLFLTGLVLSLIAWRGKKIVDKTTPDTPSLEEID
jgi:uncharacterized membrane protein